MLFSNTSSMSGRGSTTSLNPGDPEKGERSSLFRVLYWLGPPLIRACVRPTICPASSCSARLHPAAAGSRLQARRSSEDGAAPNHLSICHRPARVPFAARLDARALRRSCARTPKSGQLVPALRPTDGAECVRVQVWRRRRRRSAPRGATDAECGASACGLTPKEEAAAAAATEATCARHRRHATVSSASLPFAIACRTLRSPWGRAPSGAWVHAGSMPPASPTPSSPPRLVRVRTCNPQRLPRTDV